MELQVIIIGAVATGPKAGCRIKRLNPKAQVTMIDRDTLISYGGCGIPFYIAGDITDLKELMSTSFHMVRDTTFFQEIKGIDVIPHTEALSIDRLTKVVYAHKVDTKQNLVLPYDKLVIATGSLPVIPSIPGINLANIYPIANLHHAQAIKGLITKGQIRSAAIIGAGAIGLEMTEALVDLWGIEVHLLEIAPQVLPGILDPEIANMLATHLKQQNGITLWLETNVEAFLGNEKGEVRAVRANGQELAVDLVVLATGVRPNSQLASNAGLALSVNEAIAVDETLRTSDPNIFAGGDCIATKNILTNQAIYYPSGSIANREGRIIGTNICGGNALFPGIVGSFCIKLFGLSTACTGLNVNEALTQGIDVVAPLVAQADRAHFHPNQKLIFVKLVVERNTRKILGISALGENGDAVVGRVNAISSLLPFKADLNSISNLELCYSPPLGAALDVLNAAANTCENLIVGKLRGINLKEFSYRLATRKKNNSLFIDVRGIDNAAPYLSALGSKWIHLPGETLREHLKTIPRDKELILICNSGVRSYEAQCVLDAAGIKNTLNLNGGILSAKKWGESIIPTPYQKK